MIQSHEMGSFTFVIPEFVESDWREIINETEGIEKEILISRTKIMSLRSSIKNLQATPALLAWINLWNKCLIILEGAQSALSNNSLFVIKILERIAIENWLHAMTIVDVDKTSNCIEKEQVYERLCAYTAWALSEDSKLNWDLLKKNMLDMVYDPTTAREVKYNPKSLKFYESNFGKLSVDTDSDSLRINRIRHEERLKIDKARIDVWLKHPDLKSWIVKIRELHESNKQQTVSFFQLFNIEEKSVRKKMQQAGFGFGYHIYKENSALIHGSTIEQLNLTTNNKIIPKVFVADNDSDTTARMINSLCVSTGLMLGLIHKKVWL